MSFSESGGFNQDYLQNITANFGKEAGREAAKSIISYVTDKLDGWGSDKYEENYGNPGRALELVIVNGTKVHRLTYIDAYFAHGAVYKGPDPLNIDPGKSSIAVVTSTGARWVAGSFKYKIEGTEYFLYLGFTNPPAGPYTHYVTVETEADVSYGYNECTNDSPKQTLVNGFHVTCIKDNSRIKPKKHYKLFVYTLSDGAQTNDNLIGMGHKAANEELDPQSAKESQQTKDEKKGKASKKCQCCPISFRYNHDTTVYPK